MFGDALLFSFSSLISQIRCIIYIMYYPVRVSESMNKYLKQVLGIYNQYNIYIQVYIHTHFRRLISLPLPAGLGSDWSHGNCCVDADMTLGFTAPEVGVTKASAAEEMTERKMVCTRSAFSLFR